MAFGRLGSVGAGFGRLGNTGSGGAVAAAVGGGAGLLEGETDGFATDFTHANDSERVAVKTAGTVVASGLDAFYSNAGTSSKQVYDISGNLVWSPHNLAIQSENFTVSWTLGATPIVTAHTIQDNEIGTAAYVMSPNFTTITGETYTIAAWFLKDAVTSRMAALFAGQGGNNFTVMLNTSTGAIANVAGATMTATSAVMDAGTHWRLSITFLSVTTTGLMRVYPAYGTVLGTVAVAAVGTVTVDRVQANRGAVPTAYLPTTTAARYGLAIDYDPVTHAALGLLSEPAATNLLLNNATLSTQNATVSATTTYTLSFWGTGTITLTGVSTAGPLVGTGAANRVSLTFTTGSSGTLTLTVSGTVNNAQLEVGSAPTSLIPTLGATVTRVVDRYSVTPASINHSATAGSWWAEVFPLASLSNGRVIGYVAGTTTPIYQSGTTANFSIADTTALTRTVTTFAGTTHKVACAFASGDRAITADGAAVVTDTGQTTNLLAPGATIAFGTNGAGLNPLQGYIRKVRYVPRRKTNPELVTETT